MQIKTYKGKRIDKEHFFFILNKGNNSGKPMETACPNCFVCFCKNEEEKQTLYWLFYGLWQGRFFQPFITGSVIPYIRINDVKQVIKTALEKVQLNPEQFTKNISVMQTLEERNNAIKEQIQLIKQAKKSLMYQVLK